MSRELNFYRGLIITKPYGHYIRSGRKTIIVKSKYLPSIVGRKLLLIENKMGLGIIILERPKEITLREFANKRKYHLITETDRKTWWSGYTTLFSYKIMCSRFFRRPILLNYPTGPQITIKPELITFKNVYLGLSGYHYPQFYPKSVNMLEYYAQHFGSVEINSTFYRFPSHSMVTNLKRYHLTYSIKVNRYLTHNKKLNQISTLWKDFYGRFKLLYNQITCFLFQFSRNFHFNSVNYQRLKKLNRILNTRHLYAFEFRHKSWFNNVNVTNLFRANNWTMVISHVNNTDGWAGNLNNGFNQTLSTYQPTADFIYVRFHGTTGQYTGSYNNYLFTSIFNLVAKKLVNHIFIYFNNTDSDADAWYDAERLQKKFNSLNIV